ncbi:MAG: hypothetical protein QW367_02925 [Candidatus Aenigmatarchaeota archaeon]
MVNYEALKRAVEEFGEVMIKTDSGDTFELHKHNVTFDDTTKTIRIDAVSEIFWIDAEKIEYYWIHKKAKE